MLPKISIAVPCYEMKGKGVECLKYSFDILKLQDFSDFEVVISDHSIDDEIEKFCLKEKNNLNIKYIRNTEKRGSSSANVNSCIKNSTGKIIKILCQDDFLLGRDALRRTVEEFSPERGWLVSAYYHTYDKAGLVNYHFPVLSEKIYLINKIGTHSCLSILNEDPILFDEELIWFMDCEYYYRLYLRYGNPKFLAEPTFVQYLWEGQVTNTLINSELINKEALHVIEKHA